MMNRRDRGRWRSLGPPSLALLVMLLTPPVDAQSEAAGSDEKDELSELQALLREETELATKTRMNHDYVPGMVTVLQGEDLEALGARNVWEALSLVPGVQAVRDLYGSPLILVRGISFIFNSGNIKILVDKVPLNQESAGINTSILQLPIEEVERLELMRGPGSAIHGDAAYLGLLNIVTRRGENAVFGSLGRHVYAGGAHATWTDAGDDHRLSAGLSGFRDGDVDGSGPIGAEQEKGFGRLSYGTGGLSVSAIALKAIHRDPRAVGGERHRERRLAAEARYGRDLSPSVHAEAYAGILRNDDSVGGKQYNGSTVLTGLDLTWRAPGRHTLLLTLGYTDSEIFSGALALPGTFDFKVRDLRRRGASAALQDQWDLTGSLSLTAGVRVDDYNDIASKVTPRFALVYRLGEHQILKTQYAQGFRVPAFFELYSTGTALPTLEVESIATTELSYILRRSGFVSRLTLFQSDLTDMVQPPFGPGGSFANVATARTRGLELEWTQQIQGVAKVSANVSYVDPEDDRFTRDVRGASAWLWNVTAITEPLSWLRLAGRWSHVGSRGGFGDLPTIEGFDTVDLTASALDLVPGLTVRAGLKNAFDDEVSFITALPPPFPLIQRQYGGREFWAQLSVRF